MKLSICLNSVTGDLSKIDAMKLAGKLGYPAVEFWEGDGMPLDEFKSALEENNLTLACMGGAGNLTDPADRSEFLKTLEKSISNAKVLNAKSLIITTGWQELTSSSRDEQKKSIVDGLKEAAKIVANTGLCLCLEPLNILKDHKGYFLSRSDEGFEILKAVDSPDIKLLFDIYHQQITEGNLITNILDNLDLIGHFHVAGNPGRNEPYCGEINYVEVFRAIDDAGFEGYAGLEYWAKHDDMQKGLEKVLKLYS